MIRRIGVVAVLALLVATLLPAASASAATGRGYRVGCYGIKKKGNYNSVRLATILEESGGKLQAIGTMSVSAYCQRVNSLPVIHMRIRAVALYVNGRPVYKSGTVYNNGTKGYIKAATPAISVGCGNRASAVMSVTYDYYDRSVVRPFIFKSFPINHCH